MTAPKQPDRLFDIYRELGERSVDIMLFFHTDGVILHANPAALDAYGYSLDEILQKTFYDIRVEESWPSISDQMERARRGSFRFETVHRRKDGSRFPVEATWSFAEFDRVPTILSVIRDITHRKQIETELQRSEQRYRDFVNNSTEGVYRLEFEPPIDTSLPVDQQIDLCYSKGRVGECNDAFARMYGYANGGELIGHGLQMMLPAEDPEVREYIRSILEGGYRADEVESAELDRHGQHVYFANSISGIIEGGKLLRVWGTQRNITERKNAEQELQRAHDQLEERVNERTLELRKVADDLAAEVKERGAAEERIRNLLQRIVNVQEDERRRLARDLHDHLGQQVSALRINLATLVSDLDENSTAHRRARFLDKLAHDLDASIDALTWELRPTDLESLGLTSAIEDLVSGWSKLCGIDAEYHTVGTASMELPPDAEVQIYRITQEALQNVYKHAGASKVGVMLKKIDGAVNLSIEDDGIGFDPNHSRDHDSLGLTSMHERAALVGGLLSIESSEGKGTTILIRIPMPASV